MRRKLLITGGLGLALLGVALREEIRLVHQVATLFDADKRVANFRQMYEILPSVRVSAPGRPFAFARAPRDLPAGFALDDEALAFDEFHERRLTTGLLVLHDDAIVHESYAQGADETTRFATHSMGKAFVSALVGLAIADGAIASVDDPVTRYLPALLGSGWDGVTIEQCLHMASGIAFDEDYASWRSDINRMQLRMAIGQPLVEFIATLGRAREPGTFRQYASINSEVLGLVVEAATGRGLPELLGERIYRPMGAESDAYWLVEPSGRAIAMGGLSMTLRDYARFGRLYLERGAWEGRQLVPASWVDASHRIDAPYQRGGPGPHSDTHLAYGYQWWLPPDLAGEFMALGAYGQYIFIDPARDLVIVKTAADPNALDPREQRENIAAFRAIARHLEDE